MREKEAQNFLAGLSARVRPYLAGERPLLLVGFSGGRDSLALLAGLAELDAAGVLPEFTLAAAHFHHNLRGAAADGDQEFCRAWCARRGVAFYTARAAELAAGQPDLEERARAARYAWLAELRRQLLAEGFGPVWLLTAHHQEDQAETVLLHLLRGAGGAGLAGMRERRGWLLRPLLQTPREDIMAYLAARGLCWREDATNQSAAYTRNYLRLEVMPRLKKLNPQVSARLAQTAAIQAAAEDMLAAAEERALASATLSPGQAAYPWAELSAQPLAIRRRLVRALWRGAKRQNVCPLAFERVEEVLALAPGGSLHLAGGVEAKRRQGRLILREQPAAALERRRAKSRGGGPR